MKEAIATAFSSPRQNINTALFIRLEMHLNMSEIKTRKNLQVTLRLSIKSQTKRQGIRKNRVNSLSPAFAIFLTAVLMLSNQILVGTPPS